MVDIVSIRSAVALAIRRQKAQSRKEMDTFDRTGANSGRVDQFATKTNHEKLVKITTIECSREPIPSFANIPTRDGIAVGKEIRMRSAIVVADLSKH